MNEVTSKSTIAFARVFDRGAEIRSKTLRQKSEGKRVGLVPTMGALHAGHLSLCEQAAAACDLVVATVFVNPTQFGPDEDFEKYPRSLDRDVQQLAKHGCNWVFAPSVDEMYPGGLETTIDVGSVAKPLEGASRPTHFAGVATVVMKLAQLVPADAAYFGQKDYQQTLVVRQLFRDLHVPIEVVVCPTVRDANGLALSSRNAYLSSEDRARAPALHASLQLAKKLAAEGEVNVPKLRDAMQQYLAKIGGIEIDYIAFVPTGSVDEVTTINGPTTALVAARVGGTRLIDNLEIV